MKKITAFLLTLMIAVAAYAEPLKILDADKEHFYQATQGSGTVADPYVMGSSLIDREGKSPMSTIFGELTTGERRDDISVQFQYNNSTVDVVTTVSGTGASSNADSMAIVNSGTGVGSASVVSRDAIRYRPGHEGVTMFTAVFTGAEAGVDQKIGPLNTSDGAAFGFQDTVFGAWFVTGTTETFYPQTSFSHDSLDGNGPSGCDLDPAMMNIYKVSYGWLGIAPISYSAYCGIDKGWVLAHVVDLTNQQAEPHMKNPSLPISMAIDRASGTGTDLAIKTSSWRGGVVGENTEDNASNRWSAYTLLEQTIVGSGTRNAIFTVCSKATFQSKTNHIKVELGIVTFDNAGNKSVAFYGVKDAVLSGAGAFADINTANSVLEVADGGTITSGTRGPATVIKAGGDRRTDVRGTGIDIYPNQCLTFEAVAASAFAGTVSLSARFQENF